MPYIATTFTYPSDKVPDVITRAAEMWGKYPPNDDLAELVIREAVRATKDGLSVLNVWTPKKGKLDEALALINKQLAMFLDIPGVEWSSDTWMTAEEAYDSVDMTPPGI